MKTRTALLVAIVATTLTATPGQAAGCPLITDSRGDSTPVAWGVPTPADEASAKRGTDIVSADVWAQGGTLTAVLRVAELPAAPTVPRTYGHSWSMRLRAENGALTVYTLESNGNYETNAVWEEIVGSEDAGASAPVNLHGVTGSRDATTGSVRMSVPLSLFAPYTKVGRGVRWMPTAWAHTLSGAPSARAPGGYAYLGPGGVSTPSDKAEGTRPVQVDRPLCARR